MKDISYLPRADYKTYIIGEEVALIHKQSIPEKLLVFSTDYDRAEEHIDGIWGVSKAKKDFFHHRGGPNQQIFDLLTQKVYVIPYAEVREATNPHEVLGRLLQVIRIAHKKNVPLLFVTGAKQERDLLNEKQLRAFWMAMGVQDKILAKNNIVFDTLLQQAAVRYSEEYVAEGIRRIIR